MRGNIKLSTGKVWDALEDYKVRHIWFQTNTPVTPLPDAAAIFVFYLVGLVIIRIVL